MSRSEHSAVACAGDGDPRCQLSPPLGPGVPRGGRRAAVTGYLRYVAGKLGGAAVSLFAVLVTSFFLFRLLSRATRSRR